ncbi:hypothetical protein BDR05DRAFT_1000141 [Suillus weaverae]|nr:hypothetical protein BDR05DRAFT_1000141 [Suillus weaverae]
MSGHPNPQTPDVWTPKSQTPGTRGSVVGFTRTPDVRTPKSQTPGTRGSALSKSLPW